MKYYKLEKVRAALRHNGAIVAPTVVAERCVEVWERVVNGTPCRVQLTWESTDQILPEDSVLQAFESLFVRPIIDQIEADQGLWL